MELPAIALAIIGAIAGPAASIKVAAIQASRTLEDLTKRLGKAEERLTHIEQTEPEGTAKLRENFDALAKDVAAIRAAVDRLTVDFNKLVADDEKRRERASERAERREIREREQETALAAKLATVHTLLETLRQEKRDDRSPR
jgi:Skp family chaperone for outer membrane proteins